MTTERDDGFYIVRFGEVVADVCWLCGWGAVCPRP